MIEVFKHLLLTSDFVLDQKAFVDRDWLDHILSGSALQQGFRNIICSEPE